MQLTFRFLRASLCAFTRPALAAGTAHGREYTGLCLHMLQMTLAPLETDSSSAQLKRCCGKTQHFSHLEHTANSCSCHLQILFLNLPVSLSMFRHFSCWLQRQLSRSGAERHCDGQVVDLDWTNCRTLLRALSGLERSMSSLAVMSAGEIFNAGVMRASS